MTWPVNLETKKRKDGVFEIRRIEFARVYLNELGVGRKTSFLSSPYSGAESVSPFRLAAQDLYDFLQMAKKEPEYHFESNTKWKRDLLKLKKPMTKKNSSEWWRIAKIYLYEEWIRHPCQFDLLIKHLNLKLSDQYPYDSSIKSRVIDCDLKDAFYGIAQCV